MMQEQICKLPGDTYVVEMVDGEVFEDVFETTSYGKVRSQVHGVVGEDIQDAVERARVKWQTKRTIH